MKHLIFIVILFFPGLHGKTQGKHLNVGDTIPNFSLNDQDNKSFNSQDYMGKKILVIYFYPKDESSVCTKEACSFRDSYSDFTNAGAIVVGINGASAESHKKFQQNHHLPFTLLSDPGNKVLKMFGVKNKLVFTGRETFVVDKTGRIVFHYDSFKNGPKHQEEALAFIKKMGQ